MSLVQALLAEFDQEMRTTRRVLERVPDGKLDWKPHPKSMTLGALASHIAEMATWGSITLQTDSLDLNPPGGPGYQPTIHSTRDALVAAFDKNVGAARQALADASESTLGDGWTLLSGGKAYFTLPRAAVLRTFVLNHIIHHRGQLSVYLRENDVPVPSIYGPSADEGGM